MPSATGSAASSSPAAAGPTPRAASRTAARRAPRKGPSGRRRHSRAPTGTGGGAAAKGPGAARRCVARPRRGRHRRRGRRPQSQSRQAPRPGCDKRQRDERRGDREREQQRPDPVEAPAPKVRAAAGQQQHTGEDAHRSCRHVHEEQQAPASRRQQQSARCGADGQPERLCGALDPDRAAELVPIHRLADQRDAVGLEERGAGTLDDAREDERGQVGREPARHRGQREHGEALDIEALSPEPVGEMPGHRERADEREQVRQRHPHRDARPNRERAADVRERERDDRRVELPHERTDRDGRDDQPRCEWVAAHARRRGDWRDPPVAAQILLQRNQTNRSKMSFLCYS